MKKYIIVLTIAVCTGFVSQAQEVNWRSFTAPYKHQISAKLGLDYGSVYGLAYGYRLPVKFPVVLGTELSVPFGNDLVDDWKVKVNAQTELWHNDKFSLGIKPGLIVRRYESEAATLYNIGGEMTATFGYYKPRWGVGTEVNYDRAFATHIKHDMLKEYYPEIQDGWYGTTGGNFKMGITANYSFKAWSVFLKTGKVFAQDFKDSHTLPYYFDFSLVKYL